MHKERPTLNQIAQLANVHHTTVSRALRHDQQIPEETRQRILEIAKKVGYTPDPMLSALASYRSSFRNSRYRATLAWMTNYPTRDGWKACERLAYYRGAERRAQELGFLVEEFWLREPGMTEERANRILSAKNIQGLFFIPQPRSRAHLKLAWNKFPAITFGHTLARPAFHNVSNDHFRSFAELMRQVKKHGYRKPGFAISDRIDESTDRAWTAAFCVYQTLKPQKQVPVLVAKSWSISEFTRWFSEHRPDVIISNDEIPLKFLRKMKIDIPSEVGFVLAAKHDEASAECAGMEENNEMVGEAAVNVLAQMINHGECGVPVKPASTLIEGTWEEGSTIRYLF